MKQLEDRHYIVDENKIFIRISDSIKFGTEIYLAVNDSIDNYKEEDITDEDRIAIENHCKEHESIEDSQLNKHHKK